MKCLKCDGELHPIIKDGKSYAQCDKCGALFTRHDLKNHAPQPQTQPQSHRSAPPPPEPNEDNEGERRGMGKVAAIIGWTLCVLFLIFGVATGGASLIIFLIAALLINPIFRNRVYISGKIWIPLVVVLFIAGTVMAPTTDTEPKKVAEKQEVPAAPVKKQAKASAEKQTKNPLKKKEAAKEKAEKEEAEREEQERIAREQAEQERIAQELAAAQAEQERIAQEQAAAKAEQERIAQEQAAAQQAEQERIAREQAEQQRIAQEQAAAQQAEQERIAQEQANANPQLDTEGMVWVTETGKRYHNTNNCGNTNSSAAYQISLSEAQQKNMQPCKNCYN